MDKLAVVLALAALGVGVFAAFGQERQATTVTAGANDTAIHERLDTLTAAIEELRHQVGTPPLAGTAEATASGTPSLQGSGTAVAEGDTPAATGASRIEAMAAELEATKARLDEVEKAADRPFSGATFGPPSNFYMSADQAAKALKLDDRQTQDLEDIVASTQDQLEALMNTPNEDGELLNDIAPIAFDLEEGEAPNIDVGKIMETMGKRAKFMRGKVPGTDETYREAAARIRKDGKSRARDILSPEQAKTWDKAHTDPMFGSAGMGIGDGIVTSVSTSGPMVIESDD